MNTPKIGASQKILGETESSFDNEGTLAVGADTPEFSSAFVAESAPESSFADGLRIVGNQFDFNFQTAAQI